MLDEQSTDSASLILRSIFGVLLPAADSVIGSTVQPHLWNHNIRIVCDTSSRLRIRFSLCDLRSRSIFADTFPRHPQSFNHLDFLIRMLYQLSNNLVPYEHQFSPDVKRLFDFIFDQVPRHILSDIFALDTPTTRAAWETLVRMANKLGDGDAFHFLLPAGLKQPTWKVSSRGEYVWMAIVLRSRCTLDAIFQHLAPAGIEPFVLHNSLCSRISNLPPEDALYAIGVMRRFPSIESQPARLKTGLLSSVLLSILTGDISYPSCLDDLKFLLYSGAEVHRLASEVIGRPERWTSIVCQRLLGSILPYSPDNCWTLLDLAYAANPDIYDLMETHSSWPAGTPTIPGAKEAIALGVEVFATYLSSRTFYHLSFNSTNDTTPECYGPLKTRYFEEISALIAHMHTSDPSTMSVDMVERLISSGTDDSFAEKLLACYVTKLDGAGVPRMEGFYSQTISRLSATGHSISARDLFDLVSKPGTAIPDLSTLINLELDISRIGWMAMVRLACDDNYDAVKLLHHAGVLITGESTAIEPDDDLDFGEQFDIFPPMDSTNPKLSFLPHSFKPQKRSLLRLIACGIFRNVPSLTMMEYCLGFARSRLYDALLGTLESISAEGRLEKCRLLINRGVDLSWPDRPALLERFLSKGFQQEEEDVQVLDFLISSGAPMTGPIVNYMLKHMFDNTEKNRKVVLALDKLVRRAVNSGASLSLPSKIGLPMALAIWLGREDLVRFFLDRGAKVSSLCASWSIISLLRLRDEKSVIQAWRPLIARGFSVPEDSLSIAARLCWLGYAKFCLKHVSNVNAIVKIPDIGCHGDRARYCGGSRHLDMIQLLLNAGVGSADPGETRYDGAIKRAKTHHFWAQMDTIRKHSQFVYVYPGRNYSEL